ncbi:hypothetical protein BO221_45140 [Archangium sp. Cb G35]|uniref:metallophosphoesterase family protein n=1 Tax=Archangium sp. Cb G35 TaxID=1920190 RepID=UPI0009377FC5|nr:metallophosphoesterase [Archangium sp. Cb G35]OJT17313.1 hypothetical protein BO221_45140 [Archangium sp. Cb G35]
MDETLFSWLHLSDLHFGEPGSATQADKSLIMGDLVRSLPRAIEEGMPRPDVILVTGDIAFSGAALKETEYEEAGEWLERVAEALGLTSREVFLVPGNHDIQRATGELKAQVEKIRKGRVRLDNAFTQDSSREPLLSRMRHFLEFARGFAPDAAPSEAALSKGHLDWSHTREQHGLQVVLVGLNTAILANDERDEGRLQLGSRQLQKLNTTDRARQLVLALSHHPPGYMKDADNARRISNRAHVHLYGHVHEADNVLLRSGHGGESVRIVAGSVHASDGGGAVAFGFSFGAVILAQGEDALRLRVWPWTYVAAENDFKLDRNSVPPRMEYAEHLLGPVLRTPHVPPRPPEKLNASVIQKLAENLKALCASAPERQAEFLDRAKGLNPPPPKLLLESARQGDWHALLWALNQQQPGLVRELVQEFDLLRA